MEQLKKVGRTPDGCCAPGCESTRFDSDLNPLLVSKTFHRFPGNEVMRDLWLKALALEVGFELRVNTVVCSDHFLPEDFRKKTNRITLKPSAVPQPTRNIGKEIKEDIDEPSDRIKDTTVAVSQQVMSETGEPSKSEAFDDHSNFKKDPLESSQEAIGLNSSAQSVAYEAGTFIQLIKIGDPTTKSGGKCESLDPKRLIKKGKGKSEKSQIRALKEQIRAMQAKNKQLEEKTARGSEAIKKLQKKIEDINDLTADPSKKVSEKVCTAVVCEFLTKKGFTAAQIHSMINDSRKLKEWGEEDLADAHYLHSHGRKLYKYMQAKFWDQIPMPSEATLLQRPMEAIECVRCKHQCFSEKQLTRHAAMHQQYPCPSCSVTFKNRFMLNSHIKSVHFKLKQNQCKLCQRLFAKMENLDIHIAVSHLQAAKNDKEWKLIRKDNKHLTAPYKIVIPYKVETVIDANELMGDIEVVTDENQPDTFITQDIVEEITEA